MSSHILALAASRWLQGSAARRSDPGAALAGGSKGAMKQNDLAYLEQYGGFGKAMKRVAALYKLPEAKLTEGVSIDDYSTWRAVRFAERDEIG